MQLFTKITSTAVLTGIIGTGSLLSAGIASAAGIQGISFGGSAPSDYYVYDVSGNKTVRIPSTKGNAQKVLDGNAASPTGNVELAASSETAGFDFTKNTTLRGVLGTSYGSQPITLSSLTLSDWLTVLPSGQTLQQQWFSDLENKYKAISTFSAAGAAASATSVATAAGTNARNAALASGKTAVQAQAAYNTVYNATYPQAYSQAYTALYNNTYTSAYNAFIDPNLKLRQRLSDPNISYVNSAADGSVKIGLAGFLNANPLFGAPIPAGTPSNLVAILNALSNTPMQASELVKVTYGGNTSYLYSFTANASGLVAADDGRSHTGNYEVYLSAPPSRPVPVPAAFLGIAAAGAVGGLMMQRRKASLV